MQTTNMVSNETAEVVIEGRAIGENQMPYVIAEISANHNGSIQVAKDTILMAKRAGASAVKIQTYTPDTMTLDITTGDFVIEGGLWDGYSLYELYKEAHTPFEWHEELFNYATEVGITLFSTPFDETAVELLESLNAPAYKIASFEATDLPLLEAVGRTKKPVILSTGLANQAEIDEAIKTLKTAGTTQLVVLHCISGYPTPVSEANVSTLKLFKATWPDVLLGLSDHTLSPVTSAVAVAQGACVIEKHVTLSRAMGGPDSSFSLEENELSELVSMVNLAKQAMGVPSFKLKEAEKGNLKFRRSIYISEDVKKGDEVGANNIRRVRPGFGLEPKYYHQIKGRKFVSDFPKGTALKMEHLK